jgi:chemotaxis response regulator CheB
MDQRGVIVIGAAAGGVAALMRLCPDFPEDFPTSILVVVAAAALFRAQQQALRVSSASCARA